MGARSLTAPGRAHCDVTAVTKTHVIEETGEVRAQFSQGWVSMNDMRKKSQVLKPMVASLATREEPTPVQLAMNRII